MRNLLILNRHSYNKYRFKDFKVTYSSAYPHIQENRRYNSGHPIHIIKKEL